MSVNNINTVGNVSAVTPVNLETTDQTITRDSVHSRQSAGEQTMAASKAVLVALESLANNELIHLAKTIAARETLMSKLPSELKELVQKIFNQTQAAQTALPAGLAALLTSSRSAGEKLSLLATLLEEAAGADTKDGEQSQGKTAGKQQVTPEFITSWRNSKPDELKAAIKMLRELATAVNQTDKQTEQSAKSSSPKQAGTNQQQPSSTLQSSQQSVKLQEPAATQVGRQTVMQQGTTSQPARVKAETPEAPMPASRTAENPDASRAPVPTSRPAENPDASRAPVPTSRPAENADASRAPVPTSRPAENPDVSQSSRGETENRPINPQKPNHVATESKQQSAGMPASDRPDNAAGKQQAAPGAVRSGGTSEQEAAAVLTRMLANRPEIMKNMPAIIKEFIQTILRQAESTKSVVTTNLPEPLASLLKSPQPAADKITMLARMLEEASGLLKPEGRAALQTAVGGQQVLAEVINAWRNKNQEDIKAAAKAMRQLAETMTKTGGVLAERQTGHSVLSFSVPLYFGDGQSAYPAHIHVYYQKEDDKKNPGQQVIETWLRICLETENIGMVETAFRLYDGQNLDVKVKFNDYEAADCFADSIPAIKQQLGQLPFHLGEFWVK